MNKKELALMICLVTNLCVLQVACGESKDTNKQQAMECMKKLQPVPDKNGKVRLEMPKDDEKCKDFKFVGETQDIKPRDDEYTKAFSEIAKATGVAGVSGYLKSNNKYVVRSAIQKIGNFRTEEGVLLLRKIWKEYPENIDYKNAIYDDPVVKVPLVNEVWKTGIKDTTMLDYVLNQRNSKEKVVQQDVVVALGEMESDRSIDALLGSIEIEDAPIQRWIAYGLENQARLQGVEIVLAKLNAFVKKNTKLSKKDKQLVQSLIESLNGKKRVCANMEDIDSCVLVNK
jgi:hypothetical protein